MPTVKAVFGKIARTPMVFQFKSLTWGRKEQEREFRTAENRLST